MPICVNAVTELGLRIAASLDPMETKDTFMRFVVIGSIVAVGLLALFVTTHP